MSKRKNNELEDDRNLAEQEINDPHYWYSVSDGFRLVLWLRQKYLNYTGFPFANAGEEYVYFRENSDRVLVTDPYHSDNFSNYLNDDINKITATNNFASQTKWTQMPTTIIIPLLSGLHWRTIKINIDYDSKQVSILFDDPYGKGAFPENLKSSILPAINTNIEKLIKIQTSEVDFSLNLTEDNFAEKLIDQQGHGENSWDCGTITFSNIEDYIKAVVQGEAMVYSVPACNILEHDRTLVLTRANHVFQYCKVAGIPITHNRLDEIKESLVKEHQQ